MKPVVRFWLAWATVYAALLALMAGAGWLVLQGLDAALRAQVVATLGESAVALAHGAAIVGAVSAAALHWAWRRYALAARQLAESARVMLAANPEHRPEPPAAAELAELARVIEQLAASHGRLQRDAGARAAEARASVEEERDRFAALMSELAQGVIVCNADGRILLYNERAAALLARPPRVAPASGAARGGPPTPPLGLGRSIFALLDRDPVVHTLDRIQQQLARGAERPRAALVVAVAEGTLLRAQVAPFLTGECEIAGLVFTLDDVSGLLSREHERLKLLQALATGLRAPVANARAAAESLAAAPDMPQAQRTRFVDIVTSEARVLTDRLDIALRAYADALKASLALEDVRAADLMVVAARRIEAGCALRTALEEPVEEIWIHVDSYTFVQAFVSLALRVVGDRRPDALALRVGTSGGFAHVDLLWHGPPLAPGRLAAWADEPLRTVGEELPLTLQDVLERHGAEAWSDADETGRARLRFLVPLGAAVTTSPAGRRSIEGRPEYYDFDLFRHAETRGELADRRLAELTYTVFDTETTGLEPSAGDEIISIGAVRIVNGRLLKHETYETLVDPRRTIAGESVRIHGLDAAMLASQPTIEEVLPAFHRYCEDTVLVAHNAAFDMRFLQIKEDTSGVRFTQPVLDTLLLSAVAQPVLQNHQLETVAARLGVRVIGRHTALGDALVTGDVFLRLLPLLAERGITTLGQALRASRESYLARLEY